KGYTWKEVSVDSTKVGVIASTDVSITVYELLPRSVYRNVENTNLHVQLTPSPYFSGSIDCSLVAHCIDRIGVLVSEDTYETAVGVAVVAEATVPLVSIATTSFTAVENGVIVCDSVAASLVDTDGSEALFLVMDLGSYEQYVTSVMWRSDTTVVAFSKNEDGLVPTMEYGSPSQRIVAAGAGRMEMRGTVEVGLVAGYSGDLGFMIWSASVETAYLTSGIFTNAAVAKSLPKSIIVSVAPVTNMPVTNTPVPSTTVYPVAEAPRFVATTAEPLTMENAAAFITVSNWALEDVDGSEEMYLRLRCNANTWKTVSVDGTEVGVIVTTDVSTTVYELLPPG
ncbi:hypothetical protein L915_14585, partial [Phytophthora nicotianae]